MKFNKLRAPVQSEEIENNWAISYGDMITLLLGFFVIFFNIKTETVNLNLIKKNLDKHFDDAKGQPGRNVAEIKDLAQKMNPPLITNNLINTIKIKSNLEGERIIVEFPGISFFKSSTSDLTKEGKSALKEFAKALDQHMGEFRLVVRGYTDAKPPKTNFKYKDNLELSAFRSIAAIRLLATEGVKLEHMRIAGFGEASTDRSAKDEKFLESQRKVVIVIEPLDHTERMENTTAAKIPKNAKAIETVNGLEIPGREPSSVRNTDQNKSWTQNVLERFESAAHMDQWTRGLDTSRIYSSYVDLLVEMKLMEKGYKIEQIEESIKRYNEGRKDQ